MHKSNFAALLRSRLNRAIESLVDLRTGVDLSKVRFLCFDEADRMLDMGFIDAVRAISASCSLPNKLVCMFSATWCVTRVRGY